jgi:hypothetical protein
MDFTLSCVCFDIVHHAPYVLSITLFEFCMLRVASSFLAFFLVKPMELELSSQYL